MHVRHSKAEAMTKKRRERLCIPFVNLWNQGLAGPSGREKPGTERSGPQRVETGKKGKKEEGRNHEGQTEREKERGREGG